ncbi:MAG: hypothetical protein GX766_01335 [Firmicutes bacterium]|jgi:hypothetical protein|nr:hypothetical protein [Bacillota bacterium]HOB21819.1 hypothetical protein [Bacillota bacterium]HQD40168.1 hypothetical protein [Bacillota bacterium]
MTLKGKLILAAAAIGLLTGAFWAFFAGWSEPEPVSYPVTSPQLKHEEPEPLPPPSLGPVGRIDPFQSLLPEEEPQKPQPEEPRGYPSVPLPPQPQQPPPQSESPPKAKPVFLWKLVGIGEGAKRMALLQKGRQVLALEEGEEVDGWKLAKIQSGAVVFTQGTEKVELALEEVLANEATD